MLDRADYPEQVGVDSDVVSDLIKFFEKLVYNIDSLMVIRHGKVACECHWAPNRVDTPHDMYSLSKSVTATLPLMKAIFHLTRGYMKNIFRTSLTG